MVLDALPGPAGGDAHLLVVVARAAAGGEGVAQPEAVLGGDAVGGVGEVGGALVRRHHEVGVVSVLAHDLRRMEHLAVRAVVGHVEEPGDELAVAVDQVLVEGRARGHLALQHEAALRAHRHDHRVLDHLGLHEAQDLGAEVVVAVAPADPAAGHHAARAGGCPRGAASGRRSRTSAAARACPPPSGCPPSPRRPAAPGAGRRSCGGPTSPGCRGRAGPRPRPGCARPRALRRSRRPPRPRRRPGRPAAPGRSGRRTRRRGRRPPRCSARGRRSRCRRSSEGGSAGGGCAGVRSTSTSRQVRPAERMRPFSGIVGRPLLVEGTQGLHEALPRPDAARRRGRPAPRRRSGRGSSGGPRAG